MKTNNLWTRVLCLLMALCTLCVLIASCTDKTEVGLTPNSGSDDQADLPETEAGAPTDEEGFLLLESIPEGFTQTITELSLYSTVYFTMFLHLA